MKKLTCFSLALLLAGVMSANAALVKKSGGDAVGFTGGAADYGDTDIDLQGMSEMEAISTLRAEIQSLDEQIAQCEKQRKGWIAATVVGGAGVVGTGIGAIVQGKQVGEKKAEKGRLETELKGLQDTSKEKQAELDEAKKKTGTAD